jgi:hypothetical protein
MRGDHYSKGDSTGGGFGNYAFAAVCIVLTAVVGARVLSGMAAKGELPSIALVYPEHSLQRLAKSAPAPTPQLGQSMTIVRSVGVDGATTATIPSANKAASPCAEGAR